MKSTKYFCGKKMKIACAVLSIFILSGCAYRSGESALVESLDAKSVLLSPSPIRGKKYTAIAPVSVEIKKTTVFHEDPSEEMAADLLRKKAKSLGADAVINVRYIGGMGLLTWGYIEASGLAVRFVNE